MDCGNPQIIQGAEVHFMGNTSLFTSGVHKLPGEPSGHKPFVPGMDRIFPEIVFSKQFLISL